MVSYHSAVHCADSRDLLDHHTRWEMAELVLSFSMLGSFPVDGSNVSQESGSFLYHLPKSASGLAATLSHFLSSTRAW